MQMNKRRKFMERYKRDRDKNSYGYDYFDCYGCEYYISYHPCNRCYKKEHMRNESYKSDKDLSARLPYIPCW